jgi:hypothetical protein
MMGVVSNVTVLRLGSSLQARLLFSGMFDRMILSPGPVILRSKVALIAGSSQQGKARLPRTGGKACLPLYELKDTHHEA